MAALAITTAHYKLFPSPRNQHPTVFDRQSFKPHPYAMIHLPDFNFAGKATLFAACRLSDMKMGQLVTFELDADQARFERLYTPD